MSAIATVRAAPGLDAYLDRLEDRLADAVTARTGLVAEIGAEALACGRCSSSSRRARMTIRRWRRVPRSSSSTWRASSTTT